MLAASCSAAEAIQYLRVAMPPGARGRTTDATKEVRVGQIVGEDVVEAALGHAHVQRHLAALEAGDGDAGARLLALHAASRGLALARTRAAADAHAALRRTGAGGKLIELGH